MPVQSYVLIETEVGTAKSVGQRLKSVEYPDARVLTVDTVTGQYDVIVHLEADDLNQMGTCITQAIQTVDGVKRTTTCLTVHLD